MQRPGIHAMQLDSQYSEAMHVEATARPVQNE